MEGAWRDGRFVLASTMEARIENLESILLTIQYLAAGSFGTARDNGIGLMVENEMVANEFKHLATNFKRIEELAQSAR